MIIIILILLSAFFFIYSSYNYIIYFLSDDPNSQLITDNLSLLPRKVTNDLETSSLQVFNNDGRVDLAVQITNPNEKYLANFNYCFKLAAENISCGQSFILPSEKKYILALAREFSGRQSELSFNISDIFWRRIDPHQISNWTEFYHERLDLAVFDLNFVPASISGLSNKVNLNSLDFSIKNQTAYGYYEVPLNLFLYNGTSIVAVNRYLLDNFLPGETRTVKISWPGYFSVVNRTEVSPDLNIMDNNVYLKYQGISAN